MSGEDFPRFEVTFGGGDAFREALVVDAEEFIGVKSYKAKGKRLTTFEIESINELDPLRFKTEDKPDEDNKPEENDEENETPENNEPIDPEDDNQKIIDDITGQMTLF